MPEPVVAITRCADYSGPNVARAIRRQFELLGGIEKFIKAGDTVLIKPNFIAPKPRSCATQTDPAVIIELVKLLLDFGARPFVGDSPAWGNVFSCAKILGLDEPLAKLGVPVRQLNKARRCRIGEGKTVVGISRWALEADAIINLPKFKSHQQLVATFAVKNMFGCVAGKRKPYWHYAKGKRAEKFCAFLIEIFEFLAPVLTIIDAVMIMDGPGPINGRPRPLGFIVGGTDPIACEFACCKLVDLTPDLLPIITTAQKMHFGCPDGNCVQVIGDDFGPHILTDFQLPELIGIRFSLARVVKSAAKQLLILAKGALKGRDGAACL